METSADINWSGALKGLRAEEITRIEGCLTWREVDGRHPIFLQGEPAEAVYIIDSGRVRLVHRTEGGEEFTTGVWSKGYLIGLISAFLGQRRFLAAETVEPTVLRVLQRGPLLSCMETIPRFALNISELLALLASDSIQRSAPLALDSVEAKLGRVLVKLASPDADNRYTVRGITQDELGSMVGASRPWVNRALARFEDRGLIQRLKQRILIQDIEACRRLWVD